MLNPYSGQYQASDPPATRIQDLAADAKRSLLRVAVGNWELETGFQRALAADDEADRRRTMREAQASGTQVLAVAVAESPDASAERAATEAIA